MAAIDRKLTKQFTSQASDINDRMVSQIKQNQQQREDIVATLQKQEVLNAQWRREKDYEHECLRSILDEQSALI